MPLLLHKPRVHFHLTVDVVFPLVVAAHMLVSSQGLVMRNRTVPFGQK